MGSKRGRRWWLRVAGQGKQGAAGSWPVVGWKEDERKIKERERIGGVYIKGIIITSMPLEFKRNETHN